MRVLVHSSGLGPQQWRRLMAVDAEQDYRALALSGYGESPFDASLSAVQQDIAVVIAALQQEPAKSVHLVGHSYGGLIALLAALESDRVSQLTLIEPLLIDFLSDKSREEMEGLIHEFARANQAGVPEQAVKGLVEFWNGQGAWDHLSDAVKNVLIKVAPKIRAEVTDAPLALDREAISKLGLPAKIILSEGAIDAAVEMGQAAAKLLSAKIVHVPGGHMAPITHAQECARVLKG